MKNTIKLSKDAQRACEVLRSMGKSAKEYKTIFDKMNEYERTLMGAIVISIFSPVAGVGMSASIGHKIICAGIRERLSEKASSTEVLVGVLGKLK